MKNNRYSNTNTKVVTADCLSLSQVGVAALLAFGAVHARADSAASQNVPMQPGAPSSDAGLALPLSGANVPTMPVKASTPAAAILLNMAYLAQTTPMSEPILIGADTAPAPAPSSASPVEPTKVEFNPEFLVSSAAKKFDISRYDKGNLALPGRYRAAVYANRTWIGSTEVTLRELDGQGKAAQPVFDRDLLLRIGVDVTRLSDASRAALDTADKNGGVPLSDLIPQATATFDAGEQRLDVSIPQAMMSRNARGWVKPKFWDDGVPAVVLQYNANVYHNSGAGFSNTQSYLGLNAGVNMGPWRFRYNGNVTNSTGAGTHVQSMQTYLQRSFEPTKSQLTIGDS